jgi:thiamine-monophosphate kinase
MDPFSSIRQETIAGIGEKALLARIRDWLGTASPGPPYGMGDDAAVIPESDPPPRLVTTDSVVLDRHFTRQSAPGQVGHKLLKRNLSDIAAMGGDPGPAVVAAFLPGNTRINWLQAFMQGLAQCAESYGVSIVGGDLAESQNDLAINLTLLGSGKVFLNRQGGHPGDWLAVTGPLGGSRLGRHLHFSPRIQEGKLLAGSRGVHACIDISDGLAIDLLNLLPTGQVACLDPAEIPCHDDAREAGRQSGKGPLWHALNDGEDHELLFAVAPQSWDSLTKRFREHHLTPPVRIGNLADGKGKDPILDISTGKPFPEIAGYDHFQ